MKYLATSILFLLNNEILSLLTLTVLVLLFMADLMKARLNK